METLILIVDDEKPIRRFIRVALETQHYRCLEAKSGQEALALIAAHQPDILVLDLGLPDIDGLEVIERLRGFSELPVIVVSARGHDREKVQALDAGADDYLTKPFSVPELLARIRVALRRLPEQRSEGNCFPTVFRLGELAIDFERRRVKLEGEDVHLTPTEYGLLILLAKHAGKVLTHKYILRAIWESDLSSDTQALRVCMGNLRRKIEKDPTHPRYILTEVGVGYRMADE